MTETLNPKTVALLGAFLKSGGKVFSLCEPPALVEGRPSEDAKALAKMTGWQQVDEASLLETLLAAQSRRLSLRQAADDKGIVYHMRRQLADGDLLFIVNTSIEHPAGGTIAAPAGGIERWDPQTGAIEAYPFERNGDGVTASFNLPPCGSLLVFLSDGRGQPTTVPTEETTIIKPSGDARITRDQPNVLTLDYVDLVVGKENRKDLYFWQANDLAFKAHGLAANPWDCAVQFKDEIIRQRFPLESGFEVSYRFTIADRVPEELAIVIERPDLYEITCNGRKIEAKPDAWWLEPGFGKLDIRAAAHVGENVVTCKASPFTIWHEIEPAYVLGSFSVEPADRGFVVKPPSPIKFGPWNVQGGPFYGATVTYEEPFELSSPSGRYVVSLPAWYGSVAKVTVNGQPAGYIQSQPWDCDVTGLVAGGTNMVKVTVFGTLKNTLGPHHGNPLPGLAWPAGFRKAPETGPPAGVTYSTFGYGLFEPFVIKQVSTSK